MAPRIESLGLPSIPAILRYGNQRRQPNPSWDVPFTIPGLVEQTWEFASLCDLCLFQGVSFSYSCSLWNRQGSAVTLHSLTSFACEIRPSCLLVSTSLPVLPGGSLTNLDLHYPFLSCLSLYSECRGCVLCLRFLGVPPLG